MVIEGLIAMIAWLTGRFLPMSTLLSLGLWWGKSRVTFRRSRFLLLLFWGGIEDIARIDYLGLRSALLVTLMLTVWLISRYYQNRQLWWWYGLAVIGQLIIMWIDNQPFSLVPIIFQLIFLGLLELWSKRFGRQDSIYVQN